MWLFIVLHILFLAVLLGFSGFFSSAEVAFFSLTSSQIQRLESVRPETARRIRAALATPTRLLSSILIGNTLVNVCASGVGYSLVKHLGVPHAGQVTVPLLTLLLLIFGEIGPKRVAIHRNERLAILYIAPMSWLVRLFTPLRLGIEQITRIFHRAFTPKANILSGEEFRTLVDMSHEAGVINEEEVDIVKAIMRLADLRAVDIMIPRPDIAGLDLTAMPDNLEELIRRWHLPRLVLYRKTVDDIAGVLDVRHYLLDPERSLERATLPPVFVPKCARLNRLLEEFQTCKTRLAIVVDEYGGTAGVISRGDIVEELLGDLGEDGQPAKPLIEKLAPGCWRVDASISLEELNEALDLQLDADGVDRLSGWITVMAGRLPSLGETTEAQGCRVTVAQLNQHRITLAELVKLDESA